MPGGVKEKNETGGGEVQLSTKSKPGLCNG